MDDIMQTHDHDYDDSRKQAAVRAALMLGLGGYFVVTIASGSLTNYVNERFSWLSYVAAALFLLLGFFGVYDLFQKHKRDEHHHDHSLSWLSLVIIAIPLLMGLLIPSRPLGASAAGSVSLNAASSGQTTAVDVPPQNRTVLDWLRAFYNAQNPPSFNGQQADVIGFVYVEPRFAAGQFMVARFAISCCVADARAIGLPVVWEQAPSLHQGDWVRVQGAFQVGDFEGDSTPLLHATSVEPTSQPDHPYVYP